MIIFFFNLGKIQGHKFVVFMNRASYYMRGSFSSIAKASSLRGYYNSSLGAFLSTFRTAPENGSTKTLQNIRNHSPTDGPSHFRKLESSYLLLLSDFNKTEYGRLICLKTPRYITSRKYIQWVHADRHNESNKLFSQMFCECV